LVAGRRLQPQVLSEQLQIVDGEHNADPFVGAISTKWNGSLSGRNGHGRLPARAAGIVVTHSAAPELLGWFLRL
jgi:hypothetical protein